MAKLYGRALEVLAYRTKVDTYFGTPLPNAIRIRDMRVQFAVTKTSGSEPNKADVTISNLRSDTSDQLCRKPLAVQISAGYDGTARHLFTGDLRYGRPVKNGTEIDTELQLGDGDRAFRYARVNRSYRQGTSAITALRDAAGSMGLRLPSAVENAPELREQYQSGLSLYGSARDEFTRLLAPYGYRWSIQNGSLRVTRDDDVLQGAAWLIREGDGMIDSPVITTPSSPGEAPKLNVSNLLYPEITPGGWVKVESRKVNGIFRVEKVVHTGDTHGSDWTTAIEAKAA
jgi:hypothetical protein